MGLRGYLDAVENRKYSSGNRTPIHDPHLPVSMLAKVLIDYRLE
jgi:hypothetical protein